MTRHGPMSIEDYRAWVATYGNWTPSKKRPGDSQVEHVMRQLATALERPEAEIVEDVTARRLRCDGASPARPLGAPGAHDRGAGGGARWQQRNTSV